MDKNPSLYINLIVENLPTATEFYKTIGFVQNLQFSSEKGSAMVWKDEFAIMLLTYDFAQEFLPNHKKISTKENTSVLYAIPFSSKEAVDIFFETALKAGAKKTIETYDYGFMYGRDFEDLDGHIWEAFWMDPTGIPQA